MTLSILGRCTRTSLIGVAMVSADPFVGAYGVHMVPGCICAVQAQSGPAQGQQLLRDVADGRQVIDAIQAMSVHTGAERWQIGCLGRDGEGAALTGSKVFPWAGHTTGADCVCLGNLLAAKAVLEDTVSGFTTSPAESLSARLIAGLSAGVDRGGDKRGHRAARLLVVTFEGNTVSDIRIDDHPNPIAELHRLLALEQERAEFGELLSAVLQVLERVVGNVDADISLDDMISHLIELAAPDELTPLRRFAQVIRHAQPLREVTIRDLQLFLS